MGVEPLPPGWVRARYGDALVEIDERAGQRLYLPVLSVTKTRGPMLASERFGKAMHGRDLSKYRVAPRHHVVADPMLLWDGSIGIQRVVDEGLVSPDYRVYRPTAAADAAYLAHLVRSPLVLPHYQGGARGTNVRRNRIARSDFLSIPVALPPVDEQRKIAAILSSVDDTIEATQAVIDQLQVVKKAMMAELLTRGLPGRHTKFKMTEIGEVPEEWRVGRVEDFLTLQRGYDITEKQVRPGSVPVISSGGISYYHAEAKSPGPGVITGRKGKLGEVFYVDGLFWPHDTTLWVSDFKANDPKFITWFLRHLALERFDFATAVPTLNRNNVHPLPAAMPTIEEQGQIGDILQSVVAAIYNNDVLLAGQRVIKRAFVSVLLSGEVRVTPDEDAT